MVHPDRCFDADPTVLRVARELYESTRSLPIVSAHGHVDARILATNEPFENPTALLVTPDRSVLRMLHARGIALESLGVARCDGAPVERDPRTIWRLFARHYSVFRGTPSGMWLDHELYELFGLRERLGESNADCVYDTIAERLGSPEFRPRTLFERFGIEVLATTDAASDTLEYHTSLKRSGWTGRVIPTFRADPICRLADQGWRQSVNALATTIGAPIGDYGALVDALMQQRSFFKWMGATTTDHGAVAPFAATISDEEAQHLFERGCSGSATLDDQHRWDAHLLMAMVKMSLDDGLVMQLHPGVLRDHDRPLYDQFGPDRGGDIPVATEFTRNLRPLLNACGNDPRFTLILYTLDESTYSRELAPLAGHYPAVRLGAPWWFQDSVEGMTRYLDRVTETAGIDKLAGFVDDTRALCSIPARHDLARRVQANWLARLVSRHLIDMNDGRELARLLAYDLAKRAYRL